MLLLLRKADDVLTTYRELARTYLEKDNLEEALGGAWDTVEKLTAKIATLELENETLLREVEHWKAEAANAKARAEKFPLHNRA